MAILRVVVCKVYRAPHTTSAFCCVAHEKMEANVTVRQFLKYPLSPALRDAIRARAASELRRCKVVGTLTAQTPDGWYCMRHCGGEAATQSRTTTRPVPWESV